MDWTYLVEKFLPNSNFIVRKINTDKTQILVRIRLRKYHSEKYPEDNYQEALWQIDDNIVAPQDDLYILACEVEFGGHVFDILIIYTDPNAIEFDESYTQGPDTVNVPRSYFNDSNSGQNRETCPIFDPYVLQYSNPKSHGQSQDIEVIKDLIHNDNSEHKSEPNTDTETA